MLRNAGRFLCGGRLWLRMARALSGSEHSEPTKVIKVSGLITTPKSMEIEVCKVNSLLELPSNIVSTPRDKYHKSSTVKKVNMWRVPKMTSSRHRNRGHSDHSRPQCAKIDHRQERCTVAAATARDIHRTAVENAKLSNILKRASLVTLG